MYIPRGTLHRFTNPTRQPARMVFLFNPAGYDEFLCHVSKPARPGTPSPPWSPEDNARILALGPHYGRLTPDDVTQPEHLPGTQP